MGFNLLVKVADATLTPTVDGRLKVLRSVARWRCGAAGRARRARPRLSAGRVSAQPEGRQSLPVTTGETRTARAIANSNLILNN